MMFGGKRGGYRNCSVLYCVLKLCTVMRTQMSSSYSSLDWVLSHWAHFTVVDLFVFICVYFVCFLFYTA